jgi:hypothetical protein
MQATHWVSSGWLYLREVNGMKKADSWNGRRLLAKKTKGGNCLEKLNSHALAFCIRGAYNGSKGVW